jgi:HSP20 family molecular chaperone IbpA
MSLHQPKANIYKGENLYVIDVFLPGIEPESLNLEVNNHRLVVQALRKTNEQSFKLKREFNLNRHVDVDLIDAKLENGLLRIELPVANQHRKIAIKAA